MSKAALFTLKQDDSNCPECGAKLVIRKGKHGSFQSCSRYPECKYIRSLKAQNDGHIIKRLEGKDCPDCGATLVLRQGRYGMFVGCSRYPDCEHIESTEKPDETAILCPQCHSGKLLQRKSRFGKVFYACERYPECQFALNHTPVAGVCTYCQYPLLIEKRTAHGVKVYCASKLCCKAVVEK